MIINFKNIKTKKNQYLIFLPFLFFYIVFILIHYSKINEGDEPRYLYYAHNLLMGFYSPPAPDVYLMNGPGYPIILVPFVALHLPKIWILIFNAVFQYLSIIFLFKSLQQFVSLRKAFIFSLFWACFYNSLEYIAYIYMESFTVFLVSLLIFFLLKAFSQDVPKSKKYILLSGFIIGYIALTKIIFGYVLLWMLIGSGLLWIINRNAINYRKGLVILLIAFTTFIPYLLYTYHITGRVFYFGTGSDNLYWMSTLREHEYGNYFTPNSMDSLKLYHQKELDEINKYKGVAKDEIYKRIVIENIKSHPIKYLENCFSNIGRILFNYPYSYTFEKPTTLLRLPLNGIIVVFTLFCLIPTFMNWRKINYVIRFMLFFALLYFAGSILGSAETRMFTIIVPILLFWIAYIIQKAVKFKLKFDSNTEG
jgi:hypothetical protein